MNKSASMRHFVISHLYSLKHSERTKDTNKTKLIHYIYIFLQWWKQLSKSSVLTHATSCFVDSDLVFIFLSFKYANT